MLLQHSASYSLCLYWESSWLRKQGLSKSPGEIRQLDFKSASSLLLVARFQATQRLSVRISCIGSRYWITSSNWLARTDWARRWSLCRRTMSHLLFTPPPGKKADCLPPGFPLRSTRSRNTSFLPPRSPPSHPPTPAPGLGSLPAPHHLQPRHPKVSAPRLGMSRNLRRRQGICCANGVFPLMGLKGKWNLFWIRVLTELCLPAGRNACFF